MDEIYLSASLIGQMIAQARADYPAETCGLVAGRDGRAVRLYPVENVRHSPVAFEMDPLQQIRAMLAIENEGLEMLAIYHSHPNGPAWPSPSDAAQAYYPESAHLIISLADPAHPTLRAFMIADGQTTEIPLT
jgi:proteasome lid subunit RPN8/RPN11